MAKVSIALLHPSLRYTADWQWQQRNSRVNNRFENLSVQQQRKGRRDQQRQHFRRNQAIGLLVAAGAVLIYRLLRTPSGWIFPHGWWKLW